MQSHSVNLHAWGVSSQATAARRNWLLARGNKGRRLKPSLQRHARRATLKELVPWTLRVFTLAKLLTGTCTLQTSQSSAACKHSTLQWMYISTWKLKCRCPPTRSSYAFSRVSIKIERQTMPYCSHWDIELIGCLHHNLYSWLIMFLSIYPSIWK